MLDEDAPGEPPSATAYLWSWFAELNAARGGNGFGPNPLGFAEIAAWAAMTQRDPNPWEVDMLRSLDLVFLSVAAKDRQKKAAAKR